MTYAQQLTNKKLTSETDNSKTAISAKQLIVQFTNERHVANNETAN